MLCFRKPGRNRRICPDGKTSRLRCLWTSKLRCLAHRYRRKARQRVAQSLQANSLQSTSFCLKHPDHLSCIFFIFLRQARGEQQKPNNHLSRTFAHKILTRYSPRLSSSLHVRTLRPNLFLY